MKPPGGKKLEYDKKDGCQKFVQILVHNDHRVGGQLRHAASVHNQEEALRDKINKKQSEIGLRPRPLFQLMERKMEERGKWPWLFSNGTASDPFFKKGKGEPKEKSLETSHSQE